MTVLHSLTSMKEFYWVQPHPPPMPAFTSTIVMIEFGIKTHKWLKLLQISFNYLTMMDVHSQFPVHLTIEKDNWPSQQKLHTSIELCHWYGSSIPRILEQTVMCGHWIMLRSLYSMKTVLEQFWVKILRTWSELNFNYFECSIHAHCVHKRTCQINVCKYLGTKIGVYFYESKHASVLVTCTLS